MGKSDPADNELSMAVWFKTDNNVHQLTSVHGAGDLTDDVAALEIVKGRPSVLLYEAGSPSPENRLTHSAVLADGDWHHMAMTWTGGATDTLRLFVDGRLSGIHTQEAGAINISGWRVGRQHGGTNFCAGSMDDVRMYARRLDDGGVTVVGEMAGGDVATLYAMGIPEPGTFALLASGLLGLLLLALVRRSKS